MDEKYHDEMAQRISQGDFRADIPYYRAPFYMYCLGLTYAVFGHSYLIARLVGLVAGALSCVLILLIAESVVSIRAGIIAGILAAFYSMFMYYEAMLLTVWLEIILSLGGMYLLLQWWKRARTAPLAASGLVWGLAAVTRPNLLAFPVAFLIYLYVRTTKPLATKIRSAAVFSGGLAPAILMVFLANLVVGRDRVVIAWNGGINFYLGNNQHADGWSATSPELDPSWWGGYRDAIVIAERDAGHDLKPSEISNYWFRRGLRYVQSNPIGWLGLMAKKLYFLCNNAELSNNQSIVAFRQYSPLLRIPLLGYGLVFSIAILGMIVARSGPPKELLILFVLTYLLPLTLFFIAARYRMPAVPFLIIFSAAGIEWVLANAKAKRWRSLLPALAGVLLLFMGVRTNFYKENFDNQAMMHTSIGNRLSEGGDHPAAIREYQKALSFDRRNLRAINALGSEYVATRQLDAALEVFRQSLAIEPTVDVYSKIGLVYMLQGAVDSAECYLDKAISQDKTHPEAHYYIGMLYANTKRTTLAIEHLEASLQHYPDPKYAQNINLNLGRLYANAGQLEIARKHLQAAGLGPAEIQQILHHGN